MARLASAILAALAAIAAVYVVVWPRYDCNLQKAQLERLTNQAYNAGSNFRSAQLARSSLEMTDRCLRSGADIDLLMIRAANLRLLDRKDEAADAYRAALRLDQRPEIYFNLGFVELERGRREVARDAFITAVAFNPLLLDEVPTGDMQKTVAAAIKPYWNVSGER